jgi:hypothetical protein
MIKKFTSVAVAILLVVMTSGLVNPSKALAASVTSLSDTQSSLNAGAVSNHTIQFTTPTGVASGQTIILTFDNSTSIPGALDYTDMDLEDDTVNVTLAGSPSGATWGAVRTSGTVITFTNGTTAVAAGSVINIKIGTHATNGVLGDQQITNGSVGTTTLAISGSFTDTGVVAIPIITNDVVTVTATVNPTITFALSSNTVALGTLTTGSAGTGTHTISASTNAPGGFAVTYNGPTLTNGGNTIPVYTNGASVPGTAGFGINLKDNTTPNVGTNPTIVAGTCGIATGYGTADQYNFVASTTTTITSVSAPADCVYTASYVANIASTTAAGSYTSAITYVNTATF